MGPFVGEETVRRVYVNEVVIGSNPSRRLSSRKLAGALLEPRMCIIHKSRQRCQNLYAFH